MRSGWPNRRPFGQLERSSLPNWQRFDELERSSSSNGRRFTELERSILPKWQRLDELERSGSSTGRRFIELEWLSYPNWRQLAEVERMRRSDGRPFGQHERIGALKWDGSRLLRGIDEEMRDEKKQTLDLARRNESHSALLLFAGTAAWPSLHPGSKFGCALSASIVSGVNWPNDARRHASNQGRLNSEPASPGKRADPTASTIPDRQGEQHARIGRRISRRYRCRGIEGG